MRWGRNYEVVFLYDGVEFGGKALSGCAISNRFFEFLKEFAVYPMSVRRLANSTLWFGYIHLHRTVATTASISAI